MGKLKTLSFGSQAIRFSKRGDRVWVSLTDMAKANGKQVGHWHELKSTKKYLTKLETTIGKAIIESKVGGQGIPENERGTWAIEDVAIDFAAWCSVDFRIWVNQQIRELMTTGQVSLKPEPMALPPADVRVNNLRASMEFFDIDVENPRFKQGLQDMVGNILGIGQPSLPSANAEVWLGVAERAEQLGYPIKLVTRFRSQLGKYVKSCGLSSRQEKRLCNGTMRPVYVYLVSLELDNAIRDFLTRRF